MAAATLPETAAPERLLSRLSATVKDRLLVALLTDLAAELADESVIPIADETDGRLVGTFLPKRAGAMSYEVVGTKSLSSEDESDRRDATNRLWDGSKMLSHAEFVEAFRAAIIAESA